MRMKVDCDGDSGAILRIYAQDPDAGIDGAIFTSTVEGHAGQFPFADKKPRGLASLPGFDGSGCRGFGCGIEVVTIAFACANNQAGGRCAVAVGEIYTNCARAQICGGGDAFANLLREGSVVVHEVESQNCKGSSFIADDKGSSRKVIANPYAFSVQVVAESGQFDPGRRRDNAAGDTDLKKRAWSHSAKVTGPGGRIQYFGPA